MLRSIFRNAHEILAEQPATRLTTPSVSLLTPLAIVADTTFQLSTQLQPLYLRISASHRSYTTTSLWHINNYDDEDHVPARMSLQSNVDDDNGGPHTIFSRGDSYSERIHTLTAVCRRHPPMYTRTPSTFTAWHIVVINECTHAKAHVYAHQSLLRNISTALLSFVALLCCSVFDVGHSTMNAAMTRTHDNDDDDTSTSAGRRRAYEHGDDTRMDDDRNGASADAGHRRLDEHDSGRQQH
ncbi:hypothetical protein V8B97DRAFT_1299804 [Scleroderma yunnanense]